jgi:peroxiredoxin
MMIRLSAVLLLAIPVLAQGDPPPRSLQQLQQAFEQQGRALWKDASNPPTREQQQALLLRQTAELQGFVQREAKGDDRWNGRLMLADMLQMLEKREPALAALKDIDPKQASGLIQLTAADLASRLGDQALRKTLVDSALQRPASFAERMAMARVLMTLLREVKRGEAIFDQALGEAKDDASRAEVRWHRAEALREREDLPENTFFEELEKLAKDLPNTRWGSIARDRLKASKLAPGQPAIPFTAEVLGNGRFDLAEHKDHVVVLAFWAAQGPGAAELCDALKTLRKEGKDLDVLGIAVDPDPKVVAQVSQKLGADWPQACDGQGYHGDLCLRYGVETVPTVIVIGKGGTVAGLNLHASTDDAKAELLEVVRKARS